MNAISWPRRLLPLICVQSFLWLTIVFFAIGPWRWPMHDPGRLYAFVVCAHIAIFLGYVGVAHRAPTAVSGPASPERFIRVCLWITLAALPLASYARTGQWVPNVLAGIQDSGRAYSEALAFQDAGGGNFASYVRILLAPWLAVPIPLVAFWWGRLSWSTRGLTLFVILGVILIAVATGKRAELADIIAIMPFLMVASHWAGITRFSRRAILTGALVLTFGIAAFTVFFATSHVSRVGSDAISRAVNPATRNLPDLENPLIHALPIEAQAGFLGVADYLTTPYYGLNLAMDRDVMPMWGAGHSPFLTRNVVKLTNNPSFEKRSLPIRISDKDNYWWPILWCTAYPYYANDVGWVGTVVLMFMLGRLLALTWIDMLGGKNPLAAVLFAQLTIIAFYLPATARLVWDGEGLVSLYFWIILWVYHRPRP